MIQTLRRLSGSIVAVSVLLCTQISCQSASTAVQEAPANSDFASWQKAFRTEALQSGITAQTLDSAVPVFTPAVIALDNKQPERKLTHAEYLQKVITARRIADGKQRLRDHASLLKTAADKTGVPAAVIVALWGIETDYGRITGGYPMVDALATLAYEGRRGAFFRRELLTAYRILQEGHISADRFYGSWAGAMGQCQFMPSSFMNFAADGDGDGKKDIWQNLPDIFLSIGTYLKANGWQQGQPILTEVTLPTGFPMTEASLNIRKDAATWQALGIKDAPSGTSSLVLPNGLAGKAYLTGANFETILKWNRSLYFASAVGTLAAALTK